MRLLPALPLLAPPILHLELDHRPDVEGCHGRGDGGGDEAGGAHPSHGLRADHHLVQRAAAKGSDATDHRRARNVHALLTGCVCAADGKEAHAQAAHEGEDFLALPLS